MDLLWSDELLDEARRVLVERKPLTRGVADRWVGYLREALGAHGVEVADPDAYLCAQLDTEPEAVRDALDAQRATWGDGERTMDELLDAFGRARTPDFAQRMRGCRPNHHGRTARP